MSGIFAGLLAGGGASGDASWSYVSMLLSTTSLSNANNNLFADSSGAFNPISRTGNTTQGSFTPYGSLWSNFFDGSGDYLTAPDNAALQLGSSDFTVEFWVNFSVVPGAAQGATLVSKFNTSNTGYEVILYNNTMYFQAQTANIGMTYAFTPTAGLWYHIAWTRSGANSYGFINGVLVASTSAASGSITNLAQALQIGRRGDNTFYLNGYMSNVRVVKGTAVYTAAFTPPTAPLTAITNTSLLTCQSNGFRDASTNNFTISAFGNTSVLKFSPFPSASPGISYNQSDITNWSGYFASTGTDGLSFTSTSAVDVSTGDFTFECWVYFNGFGSDKKYIIQISGSSYWQLVHDSSFGISLRVTGYSEIVGQGSNSGWVVGQWYHVALVRSGNNWNIYRNGVSIASATSSSSIGYYSPTYVANYSSGNSINGYMSNVRLVKGTAVYTSTFTPPTSPLTAISGTGLLTLQNAAFTDNSTNNHVITPSGNTTVTGNSPFNTVGYWSNYFDGAGDYLTVPSNAALTFGTGDFTVEFWINVPSFANFRQHVSTRPSDNASYWSIDSKADGTFYFYTSTFVITTAAQPTNAWLHIAAVRASGTLTLYVNGVSQGSASLTNDFLANTLGIGAGPSGAQPTVGNISNLRIVKGTAVYTTAFTPPTAPLTAISGTSLLTCQNGRFIDNSTNAFAITVNGNTSAQSFDPFYTSTIASNGGSMYFDGTGDYLTSSNNPSFQFGTGDFTVEFWIYASASGSYTQTIGTLLTGTEAGTWRIGNRFNSTNAVYFARGNGSGFDEFNAAINVNDNAWHHVAVTRASGTARIFIDGVLGATSTISGTCTSSNELRMGYNQRDNVYMTGYLSNVRITKGTALYTAAFTPPTSVLTPSANTTLLVNGMNAGAYDATAINDMETVGNAQVSTAVSKFGGSSIYVPSGGGCALIPNSQPLTLGTGNWTIELWAYTDASGTKVYMDLLNAANTVIYGEMYSVGTTLYWYRDGSNFITGTGALTANTWQHIAVAKSGTSTKLFVNGTQVGSTLTDSFDYASARWEIGGRSNLTFPIVGYIDDLRITRGVARYTANFTPPTQAFPTY